MKAAVGIHGGFFINSRLVEQMNCPRCNATETQKFAVAFADGTRSIETTSRGIGIGAGTGVGGIVYTSGQSQSILATVSAPPPKKPTERPTLIAAFGLMPAFLALAFPIMFHGMSGLSKGNLMMSLAFAAVLSPIWGIALFVALRREGYNKKIWPNLYKYWLGKWLCRKCGAIYHETEGL